LQAIPRASGTRSDFVGRDVSGSFIKTVPEKGAPSYKELGINQTRANRALKLCGLPQAKREEFIAELKTTEKGVTPNAVWQRLRKELKCCVTGSE
jgi:hypothetical protein